MLDYQAPLLATVSTVAGYMEEFTHLKVVTCFQPAALPLLPLLTYASAGGRVHEESLCGYQSLNWPPGSCTTCDSHA